MPVAVKICGLTSAEAADASARLGAEYGGLVFAQSPRRLGFGAAAPIAAAMRGKLKIVALVVDEGDEMLARIAGTVRPDFFQLHGSETPQRVAEIRGLFHTPVIKALAVADAGDLKAANDYAPVADMLLFDAKAPKGAEQAGGHGVAFDWTLLAGRSFPKPWLLAGGLNPENVALAIRASGAALVDVSSGVESAPGVKDRALIMKFMAAARFSGAANDTVRA